MYCSHCGAEASEGAKFCGKCGKAVQGGQNDAAEAHLPQNPGSGSMWDIYIGVLKKYAEFSGRATRREYWFFQLMTTLIYVGVLILAAMFGEGIVYLYWIYSLAVFIPGLAVFVRRLHDTGHSGWWWFLFLIPFIGWIIVLVWLCTDSQRGTNKYGPNPKGIQASAA